MIKDWTSKPLSEELNVNSAKPSAEPKTSPEKQQGEAVTLIIDASESMHGGYPVDSSLQRALYAALKLADTGANVSALILKEDKLAPVSLTKEDLEKATQSTDAREKLTRDWNLGTAFAPVVDYMKEKSASGPQHFVIVSDGMMAHEKGVLLKTLDLLQNQKVTVDFLNVGSNYNPAMLHFANILARENPTQVIAVTSAMFRANVAATLKAIVSQRSAFQQKKPQATQKQIPPSAK